MRSTGERKDGTVAGRARSSEDISAIMRNQGLAALLPQMTVAEFFAGIGLMRMGLEQCGWHVVFANDIDPQKQEMYVAQFPDANQHFVLGDVHVISATQVPTVTLATASFPCNDLSLAGARAGLNGRESSAFWGFIRVLQEMGARRPPMVLLENVPGLLTSHKGQDFAQALHILNDLGYSVDAFLLDASRFVPQSRQRLFVVGIQSALFDRECETNLLVESDTRPKALINFIRSHSDIHWNIRPLPPQPAQTNRLEAILEDFPDDAPEWWSEEQANYLLNQINRPLASIACAPKPKKENARAVLFKPTAVHNSLGKNSFHTAPALHDHGLLQDRRAPSPQSGACARLAPIPAADSPPSKRLALARRRPTLCIRMAPPNQHAPTTDSKPIAGLALIDASHADPPAQAAGSI